MSNFVYEQTSLDEDEYGCFMVRIDAGITSREQLFDVLHNKLQFPEYDGKNWDALYDLLCDLSWINQQKVCIVHDKLPPLPYDDLHLYLQTLNDASCQWLEHAPKQRTNDMSRVCELKVVFPYEKRKYVEQALDHNRGGNRG